MVDSRCIYKKYLWIWFVFTAHSPGCVLAIFAQTKVDVLIWRLLHRDELWLWIICLFFTIVVHLWGGFGESTSTVNMSLVSSLSQRSFILLMSSGTRDAGTRLLSFYRERPHAQNFYNTGRFFSGKKQQFFNLWSWGRRRQNHCQVIVFRTNL